MTTVFSLVPIIILGHRIENVIYVALFLLISFLFGYNFRQVYAHVIGSMILGSLLVAIAILNLIGTQTPFIVTILLASGFYLLATPRTEISQIFLVRLNLIVFLYIFYFCVVNTDLAFGQRTIGGFADNSIIGRFAMNYGFGSPARAAVVLLALFALNLKKSQSNFNIFFLSCFFILIVFTLNRLTILFTILLIITSFTSSKNLSKMYILAAILITVAVLALPQYFPLLERFDRFISILDFGQTNNSFDYIHFVDSGQAHVAVERSADFLLTIAVVNLGVLGVFIYLLFIISIVFLSRNNINMVLIVYFLAISFKNFSFTYDIVIIFLFTIAKVTVLSHTKNQASDNCVKINNNLVKRYGLYS